MNQKRYLKIRGLIVGQFGSNYKFAHAIGTPESIISKVLHGHKKLSERNKKKWAEALKCTTEELFD